MCARTLKICLAKHKARGTCLGVNVADVYCAAHVCSQTPAIAPAVSAPTAAAASGAAPSAGAPPLLIPAAAPALRQKQGRGVILMVLSLAVRVKTIVGSALTLLLPCRPWRPPPRPPPCPPVCPGWFGGGWNSCAIGFRERFSMPSSARTVREHSQMRTRQAPNVLHNFICARFVHCCCVVRDLSTCVILEAKIEVRVLR